MAKFDKQNDDERIDTELGELTQGKNQAELAALARLFAKWSKQISSGHTSKPSALPAPQAKSLPELGRWGEN